MAACAAMKRRPFGLILSAMVLLPGIATAQPLGPVRFAAVLVHVPIKCLAGARTSRSAHVIVQMTTMRAWRPALRQDMSLLYRNVV
jgi:hypothetical protein